MSVDSRVDGWGRWLFQNRGWLPVPLVVWALSQVGPLGIATGAGFGLMGLGQCVRLWGVSHMGPAARSKTAVVRKLVYTGPYELSRNPLYIANILIFTGLALAAGGPFLAVQFAFIFIIYFNVIVRFEEAFLERKLGEIYRSYRNRVPRWLGESAPVHAATPKGAVEARAQATLRAERTTIALILGVSAMILIRGAIVG
jgi:protein-S-isoprenylcysteine O-methyltransferase Ste14